MKEIEELVKLIPDHTGLMNLSHIKSGLLSLFASLQEKVKELESKVKKERGYREGTVHELDLINMSYKKLEQENASLKKQAESLRCCGNCRYYKSHECYIFHNWEAYRKCNGEGKHKWTFAERQPDNLTQEENNG